MHQGALRAICSRPWPRQNSGLFRPRCSGRQALHLLRGHRIDRSGRSGEIWRATMLWLADVRVRWKLLGGFGLVLALMLGAGGWALWQLHEQERAYSALIEHQDRAATLAQQLRA